MKYRIEFPDLGCYCVLNRDREYSFRISDYCCRETVKVPPNVNGVPVTEAVFESGGRPRLNGMPSLLKRVFITDKVRIIEKSESCYAYMIPEIIIDENNPHFRVCGGALYRGDKLLFVTSAAEGTFNILPGTREICDKAFSGSGINKVTVPRSVRRLGYETLSGCGEIEVFDDMSAEIRYANYYGFELAVLSSESGRLLYKIYFPEFGLRNYRITQNRSAGDLNFDYYDDSFEELISDTSFDDVLRVCLERLMYPYRLSEAAEARYRKFISENNTEAVKTMIDASDTERLHFLLELGAVVPENIVELTEYCVQRKKTEFTALLLAHKGERFPGASDVFSLE